MGGEHRILNPGSNYILNGREDCRKVKKRGEIKKTTEGRGELRIR